MTIDYNLKAQIIECGLSTLYSQFSKACFQLDKMMYDKEYNPYIKGLVSRDFKRSYLISAIQTYQDTALNNWAIDLTNANDYLVHETQKIYNANYHKVVRLKKRITKILNRQCLFLTLTFTNETLAKYPNEKDLHKLVVRYLKSIAYQVSYIANVDYGEENDRIHYHAIIQIDRIDPLTWKYGNLDIKVVKNKNDTAMAKYLCKLTNHAIKNTCKGSRIIYSRYNPDNKYSKTFNNLGLSK